MKKIVVKKSPDVLVKSLEKRNGLSLRYKNDADMHATLKREGVPSLSKLLTLVRL